MFSLRVFVSKAFKRALPSGSAVTERKGQSVQEEEIAESAMRTTIKMEG